MDSEVGIMRLKIGIFGESRVGKTSLIQKFIYNKHSKTLSSDNPESHDVILTIKPQEDEEVDIEAIIFDTPGQERYYAMVRQYFEGLDGIILVYDVSNVESFEKVNKWVEKLKENLDDSKIVIFLVGNKTDLERKVTKQEGENKAKELNYEFRETSVKEGTNVNDMFKSICTKAYLKVCHFSQSHVIKKPFKCFKCC